MRIKFWCGVAGYCAAMKIHPFGVTENFSFSKYIPYIYGADFIKNIITCENPLP